MSAADTLQDLANLCAAAAHQCLDEIVALGVKPNDDAGAHRWEQMRGQLQDQMDSLSAMATKLSANAVAAALDATTADLKQLQAATDKSAAQIQKIKAVSDFITRAAQVLDVGLAVLTLASTPTSASAIQNLANKVKALASPLAKGTK